MDKEHKQFQINLFTDIEQSSNHFKIPLNSGEYKIDLFFVHNNLDELKLIGYELKSLKIKHEIMFEEICNPRSSNDHSNSNSRLLSLKSPNDSTAVQICYDINMIPRLPVIKSIELFKSDFNDNRQVVSQFMDSKFIAITSKLGNL